MTRDERAAADELAAISQELGLYDHPLDELPAAQAAIQRVRDEIDAVVAGTISPAVAVTNIVRALDAARDEPFCCPVCDQIDTDCPHLPPRETAHDDRARAEVAEAQAVRDRALMKHAEQHAEIERLRARVAELERLHTWAGLMSLLDEHYPADVVTGESGSPGPRIVALVRAVDELRRALARDTPAFTGAAAPAPVDWPARFRAAAKVAHGRGRIVLGEELLYAAQGSPDVVEAIGRALLEEDS